MATWNAAFNASPANSDSPSAGDDKIRETRLEIYNRELKEHQWGSNSTTDGYHLEGAARGYYAATAPTTRPDGVTPLGTNDEGRLWIDSDNKKSYVYSGSSWGSLTANVTPILRYVDASGTISSQPMVIGVMEIASWNMDTTASVTVTIPTGWGTYTPYSVGCIIQNDAETLGRSFIAGDGNNAPAGWWRIDYTASSYSIALVRRTSGYFDSSDFDSTAIVRGWVYLLAKDAG